MATSAATGKYRIWQFLPSLDQRRIGMVMVIDGVLGAVHVSGSEL